MIIIDPDEKVVLEVRRHWLVLFLQSSFLILFLAAPLVVWILAVNDGVVFSPSDMATFIFSVALWFLTGWLLFFVVWTKYYLGVWVVTDRRIIHVEQKHLFSREVSECRLDKVQDVTVEVHGIIPTFLRFGNIEVQTAAETPVFIMKSIPHPDKVKEAIFNQHDDYLNIPRAGRIN